MLAFITRLFVAKTTIRTSGLKARLSLVAMEDRYTPAVTTYGMFNPQPEPPGRHATLVRTNSLTSSQIDIRAAVEPTDATVLPGSSPLTARGIIIVDS